MRIFIFWLAAFCCLPFSAVLAQEPGVIRLKRPDTLPPAPPSKKMLLWLGFEGLRGIERFGQVFWPVNVNESPLVLRRSWGLSVSHKKTVPLGGSSMFLDLSLNSGFSKFQLHEGVRAYGVPLSFTATWFPGFFMGVHGTIGARYFFGSDISMFSGEAYLETGFGLHIDPHFRVTRRRGSRYSCLPMYSIHYKQIGPHRFACAQVELPLIRVEGRGIGMKPGAGPRDGF